MAWKQIASVCKREIRLIQQRPEYIISSLAVMIFCCFFYLTFFGKGMPEDLPVGIVDLDNSSASRSFRRNLDASQVCRTVSYSDYSAAREAMQKAEINAFCVIPAGMYDNLLSGRKPEITYYVNNQYYIASSLTYKQITQMVNLTGASVKIQLLVAQGKNANQISGIVQPVAVDAHCIGNVSSNYNIALSSVLLPGMLEMIIILVCIYSICSELKFGTSGNLLVHSGDSLFTAICGKLLPHTIFFFVMGVSLEFLLYNWMGFPIKGSVWNMILFLIPFILSSEAIALIICGLIPNLRLAISIGAIISVMGFTLSGFTYPAEAMPAFFRGWCGVFPLRHYYLTSVSEVIYGTGFAGWYKEVIKCGIIMLAPLITHRRLYKAYKYQEYERD